MDLLLSEEQLVPDYGHGELVPLPLEAGVIHPGLHSLHGQGRGRVHSQRLGLGVAANDKTQQLAYGGKKNWIDVDVPDGCHVPDLFAGRALREH